MASVKDFFTSGAIKNIQTLLVDCDGVLYDDAQCTNQDMQEAIDKTLNSFHIPPEMFAQTRADLKKVGIRGLFNSALDLCYRYHVLFDDFAEKMVANTNYSKISSDPEMIELLKKAAQVMPVCIVTNNTAPHLRKIFDCLRGRPGKDDLETEVGIQVITIENTLYDDPSAGRKIFHPKQKDGQFARICSILEQEPATVGILDDTERIRNKAQKQGLVPIPTDGPADTKDVLRQVIAIKGKENEKINFARVVPVR